MLENSARFARTDALRDAANENDEVSPQAIRPHCVVRSMLLRECLRLQAWDYDESGDVTGVALAESSEEEEEAVDERHQQRLRWAEMLKEAFGASSLLACHWDFHRCFYRCFIGVLCFSL